MSNKKISALKKKVDAIEHAQISEIDTISAAIKDIYMAMDKLIEQSRQMDATLAAVRYLLIAKKLMTSEEIESKRESVVKAINAALDKLEVTPQKPLPVGIESELEVIHKVAAEAAKAPYPDEAFIFGG